jgi:hypothetical protein
VTAVLWCFSRRGSTLSHVSRGASRPEPLRSPHARLLAHQAVADLDALPSALGTTSRSTVFRALSAVGYLTSYSHVGRYYSLQSLPRFDEDGLWAHGVVLSQDITLLQTVLWMVETSSAGHTQPELQERLRL